MEAHLIQWLNLALRWTHVVVGIAWVGTAFYFNWLNGKIKQSNLPDPGLQGELWSVHGGGFYRTLKYAAEPGKVPISLQWFKWEAYWTWITGFALLVLVYYAQAGLYLVDPGASNPDPSAAIAVGLGTLILSWLVYDALCRSPLAKHAGWFGLVSFGLLVAMAWGLSRVLSPRAAYLHVGAALGTIMAANVFRVIIPSQRRMVQALEQGRSPEHSLGHQAALRSLHNNYLALPVVLLMISIHYPEIYGHGWSWAVLGGLSLIGAGVRHWFNLRNRGQRNWWLLPAALVGLLALVGLTAQRNGNRVAAQAGGAETDFARVRVVMAQRCASCHSSTPTDPAFPRAPLGVVLDTPEQIRAQAQRIYAAVVATRAMPLGNVTGMTEEERSLLGRWIRSGAPLR